MSWPISSTLSYLSASLRHGAGVESAQNQAEFAPSAVLDLWEDDMRRTLFVASALLLCGILFPTRNFTQDKPAAAEPKMTQEDVNKKNPISPTAENLAEARKFFGYNCAMCHGKEGDGKGDLAQEMKLDLPDWRNPSSLEKMTDGELFWIISNGKGKMPGDGDRDKETMRWKYVNLVRSFGKKGAAAAAEKPKTETPQPQN